MFEVEVLLHAPSTGWVIQIEVLDAGRVVVRDERPTGSGTARFFLSVPGARLWSPESPHLYDIRVRLLWGGHVLDEVLSYAGMRSVELRDGLSPRLAARLDTLTAAAARRLRAWGHRVRRPTASNLLDSRK
jgi:beta-galactosidase/beta-glucuronidase